MKPLHQILKPLLAAELQALIEKIDSLDADHEDHEIAAFINQRPLRKLERLACVLAYRAYEDRITRHKAMELVCPPPPADAYQHKWTQAMTLDSNGNLGVGAISTAQNLVFSQANGTQQFELIGQPKKRKIIRSKVSL